MVVNGCSFTMHILGEPKIVAELNSKYDFTKMDPRKLIPIPDELKKFNFKKYDVCEETYKEEYRKWLFRGKKDQDLEYISEKEREILKTKYGVNSYTGWSVSRWGSLVDSRNYGITQVEYTPNIIFNFRHECGTIKIDGYLKQNIPVQFLKYFTLKYPKILIKFYYVANQDKRFGYMEYHNGEQIQRHDYPTSLNYKAAKHSDMGVKDVIRFFDFGEWKEVKENG